MDDLLPCPFCGSHAEILDAEEAGTNARVVQCMDATCHASSAVVFALMDDVTALLVERWNRRPSQRQGADHG